MPSMDSGRWRFDESIAEMREDIRLLKKDMWIGNGKPSVTARMLAVEECVDSINQTMNAVKKSVDELKRNVYIGIGILMALEFLFKIKG
jgi:hypothetical protein